MRRALLVAALLAVAGCTTATAPLRGPTATETPTPTACVAADQPTVTPVREDVRPRDLPAPPTNLTRDSALEFAVAYERAYTYNSLLETDTRRVEVVINGATASSVDGGYFITIDGRWATWEGGLPREDGDGTTTPVHADGPYYTVGYLVTDDRVVRHEAGPDDEAQQRGEGTTLECWG